MVAQWFFHQWQRKCLALAAALVVWFFINQSIIETKVIPNVPIRIINLPRDKTVIGLLSNGIMRKRVSLSLSGSRDVINALEPGDIEVIIDASAIDRDDWIVKISKKNLVSLNPNIDLSHHITSVTHNDFVIKLSPVAKADVPVIITKPNGEAPGGYEFLDLWPSRFTQKVTGPAEEVLALKNKGIKLSFDLSRVSKEELDKLRSAKGNGSQDEVSFPVPKSWKMLRLPLDSGAVEELNDPEAETIVLNFLYKDFLPIEHPVPIRVYYPLEFINTINPLTYALTTSSKVDMKNGIFLFTFPLYVKDVSRLFLDVIRDSFEITLVAAPPSQRDVLDWSIEVIDPRELQDTYIAYMLAHESNKEEHGPVFARQRTEALRQRFMKYQQKVQLWVTSNQQLSLETVLENQQIKVK